MLLTTRWGGVERTESEALLNTGGLAKYEADTEWGIEQQ